MKLVFVLECANSITNGTGATCHRFAKELEKLGHEVTMLCEKPADPSTFPFRYFGLEHYKFPVFESLILKDGFNFVKCDPKVVYEAIKGADLVHLFIPFKLCSVARLIAEVLDVPVTAAFHLQPQNITSAIHMGKFHFANWALYLSFKNYLFDHVRHIHCPSEMIKNQLISHHYNNNVFHVISNGYIPYFHKVNVEKPAELKDKIIVTMSGRLAGEKRQDIIIKAVSQSKYNDKIQIVFCGKGPKEKHYKRLAEKKGLANPLIIKFCDQEQLREILSNSDIYIHASDFEIEGISAIEAFACGAVPLISDSKLSATNSFSLSPKCIFKHGSWRSLKKGLEYFIEHEEERKSLSLPYQEMAKNLTLDKMVNKMVEMFEAAIKDHQAGCDIAQNRVRKKDEKKKKKIFKKLIEEGVIDEMPANIKA